MFDIVVTSAPATPFAGERESTRPQPFAPGDATEVALAAAVVNACSAYARVWLGPQVTASLLSTTWEEGRLHNDALDAFVINGDGVVSDLSAHPERLLCFARPPLEAALQELAALYEGIVEAALGATLGGTYAARCVEGRDLEARPWRFALVQTGEADVLEARPGERPDDVLRRLGLATAPAE